VISPTFNISASALRTADKVTAMISQNIANADTPGYRRLENRNYEINHSGPDNKPFLPGGVGTDIFRTGDQWTDRRFLNALYNKSQADAENEGVRELDRIATDTSLEEAFTAFMSASQDLMANPKDIVYQERLQQTGEHFVSQLNRLSNDFSAIKNTIREKIDLNNIQLNSIQDQLAALAKKTPSEDVVSEINYLKQQLSRVTGTLDGYNKVLRSIIPPIETMYREVTEKVVAGTNESYSGTLIENDGEKWQWNRGVLGDIVSLTEFSSQGFNKEIGRIKTVIGSLAEQLGVAADAGASALSGAQSAYDAAYGVDLVQQSIKLKEY
jgi:hypothetical protein